MSEKDDEKKEPRRFIQSSREIINQIIKERNHGPGCICDDCLIFKFVGAEEAKEQLPGAFQMEHKTDKDVPPS